MQNERQPLYKQIQNHFEKLIRTGELNTNDQIPTEKELIEQFGVSRITVVKALTELAENNWIYRIPGRGSFVSDIRNNEKPFHGLIHRDSPSHTDGRLAKSRCIKIGLVLPILDDFFAIRLVNGIQSVLDKDVQLMILLTRNSKEIEKRVIKELLQQEVDGIIVFPVDAQTYNEEILSLKMSHFPFVLIDRHFPGIETHFVRSDSYLGAKLAVNHLWELGHRKIAICTDSPLPTVTVSDRISGYMDAIKDNKGLIDPSLILSDFKVDYSTIDVHKPIYLFLKNNRATAYITLNARLGQYIHSICKRLGIQVPTDISLITFDNAYALNDEYGGFTYINQNEEEIGRKSAKILMELIKDSRIFQNQYQKIILKPELIVKNTTSTIPLRGSNK